MQKQCFRVTIPSNVKEYIDFLPQQQCEYIITVEEKADVTLMIEQQVIDEVNGIITIILEGKEAKATILAATELEKGQTQNLDITIKHEAEETESIQEHRYALTEDSKAAIKSLVIVQKNAAKAVAKQNIKTLLLGEKAKIEAKPELEVHTSDVKCEHGATKGSPNKEQRQYLQSRGLSQRSAERLMKEAFLAEIQDQINSLS